MKGKINIPRAINLTALDNIGNNNANNGISTSKVTSNRDGTILERSEWVIQNLASVPPSSGILVGQSEVGTVEEDSIQQFSISLADSSSGSIAVANINITAITNILERSRAGGAFSPVGITQPTFAKSNGNVSCSYRFLAAEWQVGDMYRLVVGGITCTIGGIINYVQTLTWSNLIVELGDLTTKVDNIQADIGDFSAQVNLSSLLNVLGSGWNTANKDLYTALITDRLDNATYGLSVIEGLVDDLKTRLSALRAGYLDELGPLNIPADIDTLLTRLSAVRAGYLDELGPTNIPADVDVILLDTQIRRIASGSKTIATGVTKYLSIDSGTNGAEILSIVIKGIVGADWTLGVYIPVEDAVAAVQASDKRDEIKYTNTDTEGGLLQGFGLPYNVFLNFTNDSGGDDNIDEVIIVYKSRSTLTLTWEA